jgi:membrane protease YdiL (CAAX protease family)
MRPFFLSDTRTKNWPQHILTVSMVLLAYFLGQFPLLIVLGNMDLLRPESIDNTGFMAEAVGYNYFLALILLPFVLSFLALIISAKYFLRRSIRSLFTKRHHLDWRRIFVSFILWFLIMLILFLSLSMSSGTIVWNFEPASFAGLLVVALFMVPLQTTCEELIFRGYLMQLSGAIFKKGWMSVLFTGVIFGLIHASNPEVDKIGDVALCYYIGTGIFLGLITVMDDGIELGMGFHAANNIFAAVIVTNDWQAFRTDALYLDTAPPSFGWDSILTLLILQPLLVFVFAKLYRWKNWRSHLFENHEHHD